MEEYAYRILKSGIELSPIDMYDYTIPELSSLFDGFNTNVKMQKVFFGNLTASVYNTSPNRRRNAKILGWRDIYPSNDGDTYHTHKMTNDEIKSKLKMMFGGNS